ncbi:unnamed protein product [Ambrosiozyma monospora]|uniref:Unnamed protein product n=1 Tax=Ambrosiozyma monospora TaxID=43982 RepID=A0ACB5SUI8_AMBMO|nr:unnamed protein product [Ambrosiozyma monospora]
MNNILPTDPSKCDADAFIGEDIVKLFYESSKKFFNLLRNSANVLNEISNKDNKKKFKAYHELLEFIDTHTSKFIQLVEESTVDEIKAQIEHNSPTRALLYTCKYLDPSPIILELIQTDKEKAINFFEGMLKLMDKIIENGPTQTHKFSPTMFFLFMQFAYHGGIFKIKTVNYSQKKATLYLACKCFKTGQTTPAGDVTIEPIDDDDDDDDDEGATGIRVPSQGSQNKPVIEHCPATYTVTFDEKTNIVLLKTKNFHTHDFAGHSGLNYLDSTPFFLTKLLAYITSTGKPLGISQTHLNKFLDGLDVSDSSPVHQLLSSFKQYTITQIKDIVGLEKISELDEFMGQAKEGLEKYLEMLKDTDDFNDYKVGEFRYQVGRQERHGVFHITKSLLKKMLTEGVIYLDFTFKPIAKKGIAMGNIGFVNRNKVYVPCSILSEGGEGTNNVCQMLHLLEDGAQEIFPELSLHNIVHIIIDQSNGEISGIEKFFLEQFGLINNSKNKRNAFIENNIDDCTELIKEYFGPINYSTDPKLEELQKKALLAYISPELFPTSPKILFCTWHKSVFIGKRFGSDTVEDREQDKVQLEIMMMMMMMMKQRMAK